MDNYDKGNRIYGSNDLTATPSMSCIIPIPKEVSIFCRICYNTTANDRLIAPCLCKGTLTYVHRSCLEHWLNTSGMVQCELCQYRYPTEETLRYTCCQSIRIWYRHPNNRGLLQADSLLCGLLTVVTCGLVAICMFGLHYFSSESYRLGVSRLWTQGSIIVFLVIVIFAYCINLFYIFKSEMVPWYRWWQSARSIKLLVVDRRIMNATAPSSAPPTPPDKKVKRKVGGGVAREIQSMALSSQSATPDQGTTSISMVH